MNPALCDAGWLALFACPPPGGLPQGAQKAAAERQTGAFFQTRAAGYTIAARRLKWTSMATLELTEKKPVAKVPRHATLTLAVRPEMGVGTSIAGLEHVEIVTDRGAVTVRTGSIMPRLRPMEDGEREIIVMIDGLPEDARRI